MTTVPSPYPKYCVKTYGKLLQTILSGHKYPNTINLSFNGRTHKYIKPLKLPLKVILPDCLEALFLSGL